MDKIECWLLGNLSSLHDVCIVFISLLKEVLQLICGLQGYVTEYITDT